MSSTKFPRRIARHLLLSTVFAGLALFMAFGESGWLPSEQWVDAEVRGRGWLGMLIFVGIGGFASAFAFPRQMVAFLAGYAFGFGIGSILAVLAALLGCMLAFSLSRSLFRSWLQDRFSGRIRAIDGFLRLHPFSMAVALRLLPLGSNALISLLAGMSSVRGLPFFAGSGIGYIPQSLIFALAGSGIAVDSSLRLGLAAALLLISSLIGFRLYRSHRGASLTQPSSSK